jgi:hypothetical protein
MKIYFPNYRSGAGISLRAAIDAWLNSHKAERTQTAARKRNVPQITPGWDYRPRESIRRHAAVDVARAKTARTLSSSPAVVDASNVISFDLINRDPAVEHERTKAPLSGHESAVSGYD